MTGTKNPWFKFFPSDWRADQALRMCSVAARGLWLELMCIMHEAEPYGHLVVNGHPVTDTQIASLTGVPLVEVEALLIELESAGVFSRNRNRVIYSRRMTRDERKRKDGRKSAETGTLPTSRRGRQSAEKTAQNKPPSRVDRGVDEKPPPDPYARSHMPDIEYSGNRGDKSSAPAREVDGRTPQPSTPATQSRIPDDDRVRHETVMKVRSLRFVDKASAPNLVQDLVDHGADPLALMRCAGECSVGNLTIDDFKNRARALLPDEIQSAIKTNEEASHVQRARPVHDPIAAAANAARARHRGT